MHHDQWYGLVIIRFYFQHTSNMHTLVGNSNGVRVPRFMDYMKFTLYFNTLHNLYIMRNDR
jgi:hypothetical protein